MFMVKIIILIDPEGRSSKLPRPPRGRVVQIFVACQSLRCSSGPSCLSPHHHLQDWGGCQQHALKRSQCWGDHLCRSWSAQPCHSLLQGLYLYLYLNVAFCILCFVFCILYFLFIFVLPYLIILFFKLRGSFTELSSANINREVITEIMSLGLWPKSRNGKKIALAMTIFTFFLYGVPNLFVIMDSRPTTMWTGRNETNSDYAEYESELGSRLQFFSISFLTTGSVAFVLVICMILFEDQLVARIVSKFPKNSKDQNSKQEQATTEVETSPNEFKDVEESLNFDDN